ncbi:MAG TPA: cytochrome c [Puia sp.]|jgi:mono/diheme cytochrome c family protein|nr:cytochrome c [Puia sp.]
MKRYLVAILILAFAYSCSNNSSSSNAAVSAPAASDNASGYDSLRGSGKFTHVDLAATLDPKMVDAGKSIYDLKCSACHKLTSEKLVGPGWLGVTGRHKPEWIMNFVTNTDEMIDKDPKAQAMLQICMVRMPNQHLSDDDARHILEFMRNNDQGK